MTTPDVHEIIRHVYADQRAHDITWMTAGERNAHDQQQERVQAWRDKTISGIRATDRVCPKR